MDNNELEILVLEAQAGSKIAIQSLYKHFNQSLKKYAYVRVKNKMIAEDLTQNVWLKVFRRLGRLKDVSIFRSWLFRALRWEIEDWYRSSSREVLVSETNHEPSTSSEKSEDLDLIPLLGALENSDRETAELYYLNDLSVREIALVLSIPEGTVKSRLYRARAALKKVIQKIERN